MLPARATRKRRPEVGNRVSPAARARHRDRTMNWVLGVVVVVAYVVVQLLLLQGPHPFDPAYYFRRATEYPDVEADLWTMRIALMAAVRAAFLLFGRSEAGIYAVPVLSGMLLVGSVYAITLWSSRKRAVAMAAGLLVALNPYLLLNWSHIFPDTTATATLTLAFLLVVAAARRYDRGQVDKTTTAFLVLAGVTLAATYLIREFTVLLFPVVVAAALQLRFPRRAYIPLAAGAAGAYLVEPLYGWLKYDQALIHLDLLFGRGEKVLRPAVAAKVENYYAQIDSPVDALLVFPRLLLSFDVGWLFLLLLGTFVAALVITRDRGLRFLATWCFGFWAVMIAITLGRLPSGRWVLNTTNIRYWYPIFPPLVMGGVGGLYLLLRKLPIVRYSKHAVAAAVGAAMITVVPAVAEYNGCEDSDAWRAPPRQRWVEFRDWLSSPDAERFGTVWVNKSSEDAARVFIRSSFGERVWPGDVERISGPAELEQVRSTEEVVLVDPPLALAAAASGGVDTLGPEDWVPVFASSDRTLVAVTSASADPGRNLVDAGTWWTAEINRADLAEDFANCGGNPYERLP